MESKKVKEIKKALESMSGLCKDSLSSICFECEINKKYDEEGACKEALTLINELENENANKTDIITDLLKKQEFYETEKLKQFAERLKGKLNDIFSTPELDLIDETLKEMLGEE